MAGQLRNQHLGGNIYDSTETALRVNVVAGAAGGSTQVSIKEIQTSSGASVMDTTNASIGVTIRAGSAAGTEYTDGDVDATPSGGAVVFSNGSNTMRVVSATTPLPVTGSFSASTLVTVRQSTYTDFNTLSRIADRDAATNTANVTNTTPASTAYALAVREVAHSTTVNVSSVGGAVVVRSSAANALFTAYQSSAADLNVTVAGYVAPSTLITIRQSTYTDLNALSRLADRDASTAVAAVVNATQPASSAYGLVVRLPAPITDSTNSALRVNVVAGAAGGSTDISVTQLRDSSGGSVSAGDSANNALRVNVVAGAAGGSTVYTLSRVQDSSNTGLAVGDSENNAIRVNVVAGAAAGSTLVTVRQSTYTDFNTLSRLADRDASTQVANITNTTPASTAYGLVVREAVPQSTTVNVSSLGGAVIVRSSAASLLATVYQSSAADLNVTVAGYSTTVNVSSLGGAVITRSSAANMLVTGYQSTYTDFNALSRLADRDNSTAVAAVVNATQPASTAYGLVVRFPAPFADSTESAIKVNVVAGAAGGSTLVTVRQSTVSDLLATVYQSSAADLNVTVAGYSTTAQVSSVGGVVQTRLQDSSGVGIGASTAAPAFNVSGLHTRPVMPTIDSTTVALTSSNSTVLLSILSSNALRHKVFAYAVMSTTTVPSTLIFMTNSTNHLWSVMFGSGSSGVTGANLAVSPPAWLFASAANSGLQAVVQCASTGQITRVSVSWFTEA
jgi:hypothetical protein